MDPDHTPLRRILYPLYVATLFGSVYGITIVQAAARPVAESPAARTASGAWASPSSAMALVILLGSTYALGSRRGPVVPDIGFIDLLVPSSHDRASLLREWWHAALTALTTMGLITGVVIGVGLSIPGLITPPVAAITVVVGVGLGRTVAQIALRAQALAGDAPPSAAAVLRTTAALGHLHQPVLRAQAVLSRTASAAVHVGDLGHLRREGGPGSSRLRSARLRPGGRVRTLVSAELLIWRRTPWRTLLGIAGVVLGGPLLVRVISEDDRTIVLGPLLLLLGVGSARLLPGLRSLADNGGSPTLLGLSPKRAALVHLAVGMTPLVISVLGGLLWVGTVDLSAVAGVVGGVTLVGGVQLFAGFRGGPDLSGMMPQSAAQVIVFWLAMPYVVPLLFGLLTHQLAATGVMHAGSALLALSAIAVILGWWQLSEQTAPEASSP